MIRKIFLFFVWPAFVFYPVIGQTGAEQSVFNKANDLYLAGDYSGARDEYLRISGQGVGSSELFFNLGNTYYKLGQFPAAILFYEKALNLSPKDEDIRFNLDLANRLVIDKINPVNEFFMRKWIRSFAGLLKTDVWALISLISFAGLLIVIMMAYASRGYRLRGVRIPLSAVLLVILGLSLTFGSIEYRLTAHSNMAIVFSSSLTAKSSPDAAGTDLFVIHEGLKVRIVEKVGTWIRIRLADGNEAWIPENSVERI